ncbi:hypothetical protein SDC9_200842 [bioreactor metagenome]|uniref:Uncharacterized protein n=1 Tax=bioreactor metagenome TaxID=1076179 RepID=A0A645IPB6_9ZZZZ
MDIIEIIGFGILGILILLFFYYVPFLLWVSAKVSGVNISLIQLFLMRIRKVPPHIIVACMIEAHKADLHEVTRDGLEAHYLAGDILKEWYMHWYLHQKPISTCRSKWQPLLTWLDVMCFRQCKCR